MTYNMSGVETADNIAEIFLGVNTATQGYYVTLSGLVLMAVFMILLVILLRYQPAAESVLASSAVCTIAGLLFFAMGALSALWVVGFGIIFAISAVGVFLKR